MNKKIALLFLLRWSQRHRQARQIYIRYAWYHYWAYVLKSSKHVSILSGVGWVNEVLRGNEADVIDNFRMSSRTLHLLVDAIVTTGSLVGGRDVFVQEQVAMFLYFVGDHASSRAIKCRFQRYGETVTRHLHAVMASLVICVQLTSASHNLSRLFIPVLSTIPSSALFSELPYGYRWDPYSSPRAGVRCQSR
ncbi:hypothetical protein AaE_007532 [Aphanomyces astaci]|uniref:DUF8040 domain-containing protein n=1 Tax=Aphanomyces astaci TaxID=112090 RepID=A0A6A5A9X7_APHAT|nr:hypothetical protein AaE_007532 [Aphanomyces astaci]